MPSSASAVSGPGFRAGAIYFKGPATIAGRSHLPQESSKYFSETVLTDYSENFPACIASLRM
jgi:hypothetical protein